MGLFSTTRDILRFLFAQRYVLMGARALARLAAAQAKGKTNDGDVVYAWDVGVDLVASKGDVSRVVDSVVRRLDTLLEKSNVRVLIIV